MSELAALIAAELAEPVDPRVTAMAAAIAARYPRASRAVLFYGSCLRSRALDEQMLDFYLIVSDYRAAYGKSWLGTANRLIPPNVFPFAEAGLSAKYAVLSEADFARLNGPEASTVSVWARFAQPSRLVWSAGADAGRAVVAAIARAPATLLALAPPAADPLDRWRAGFALTYRAELRAERGERADSIVDHDPQRYRRLSALLPGGTHPSDPFASSEVETPRANPLAPKLRLCRAPSRQIRARLPAPAPRIDPQHARTADTERQPGDVSARNGKLLTVARLAKASLTFAGGIDYLAWKIERHSGERVAIKPWHRRAPLIAALILLPRLWARGAIR